MYKRLLGIFVLVAALSIFVVSRARASDTFPDVPDSHWAHDFISWLFNNGLTSGFPDGTYRPDNNVTRAEMAVFLQQVAGAGSAGPVTNADKLDGLDSTAFLGATDKAVDSDKLDGVDSTGFHQWGHTLPPGETLVGSYAVAVGGTVLADGLIFNPPLSGDIPLSDAHFIQSAAFTSDCPGYGQAADGHLCVYETSSFGGMTLQCFCDPLGTGEAVRSFGTSFFMDNASANTWAFGNWAVTSSASLVPLDVTQTASSNSEIPGE